MCLNVRRTIAQDVAASCAKHSMRLHPLYILQWTSMCCRSNNVRNCLTGFCPHFLANIVVHMETEFQFRNPDTSVVCFGSFSPVTEAVQCCRIAFLSDIAFHSLSDRIAQSCGPIRLRLDFTGCVISEELMSSQVVHLWLCILALCTVPLAWS